MIIQQLITIVKFTQFKHQKRHSLLPYNNIHTFIHILRSISRFIIKLKKKKPRNLKERLLQTLNISRYIVSFSILLIFSGNSIFLLHLSNLILLLLLIKFLAHLRLLIIQNNQIPIGYIKPRQVIHRRFGIVNIFVNHKRRSARVLASPNTYLANGAVLAEYVVHLFGRNVEREVSDVENSVHFWWKTGVALPQTDCRHYRLMIGGESTRV